MNTLYERIAEEEALLKKQINLLTSRSKTYPQGTLRISYSNGCVQYYIKDAPKAGERPNDPENNSRGKRLGPGYRYRRDRAWAASIAQRDYELLLLKDLETRLKAVIKVKKAYNSTAPEAALERFSTGRKQLICPLLLTDEEYAKQWQMKEYSKKFFW